MDVKRELYEIVVVPTVMYGAHSRCIRQKDKNTN